MNIFAELSCFNTPTNLIYNKKFPNYLAPDFPAMIKELCQVGWTHEKLAFLLPVSGASTIIEWACGSFMNYDNGEAFIELWKHLTDKTDQEIPRTNRYFVA